MTPDLNSRSRRLSDLRNGVDRQVKSRANIVRKRELFQHVASGDKIRAGDPSFEQQGNGKVEVLGIAVIKGDRKGSGTGFIGRDPSPNFGQADALKMSNAVVDVPPKFIATNGPRVRVPIGDAMIKKYRNRRSPRLSQSP
jgi:hypothetical protein